MKSVFALVLATVFIATPLMAQEYTEQQRQADLNQAVDGFLTEIRGLKINSNKALQENGQVEKASFCQDTIKVVLAGSVVFLYSPSENDKVGYNTTGQIVQKIRMGGAFCDQRYERPGQPKLYNYAEVISVFEQAGVFALSLKK